MFLRQHIQESDATKENRGQGSGSGERNGYYQIDSHGDTIENGKNRLKYWTEGKNRLGIRQTWTLLPVYLIAHIYGSLYLSFIPFLIFPNYLAKVIYLLQSTRTYIFI